MRCSELMKKDVECCPQDSTANRAAAVMRDRNVGFLPVCDANGVPVGTLTDRDLAVRVIAAGRNPSETRVNDVMTRQVVTCRPDDDLAVAEKRMSDHHVSRILCTDGQGHVAGVISLSRILDQEPPERSAHVAASVAEREAAATAIEPNQAAGTVTCADVMSKNVTCCALGDTARGIADAMRRQNIGFVPVCDESGSVVGTITDRDLTVRVIADGRTAEDVPAAEVFSPGLLYCAPDDDLAVAENLMLQYRKSRILCADEKRRPLGVISLSDIARVAQPAHTARVLGGVASRDG